MKAYYFFGLFIIVAIFSSCYKKEAVKPSGDYAYLIGKWRCAYTFGTFYGSPFFNDSTGAYKNQVLEIDKFGKYKTEFIYDGYENKQTGIIQKVEAVDSSFVMKDFYPTQKISQQVTFKMYKPKNGTNIFYEPVVTFIAGKSINAETSVKEKEGERLILAFLGNPNIKVYCAYFKE